LIIKNKFKFNVGELCLGFSEAAKNQAAFDRYYYDFFDARADAYGYLPRPARWLNKGARVLVCLRLVTPVLRLLWFCFAGVYFFLRLMRMYFSRSYNPFYRHDGGSVFLAVCKRSIDVARQAKVIDRDTIFLRVPSFRRDDCSDDLSVLSFLSFKDFSFVLLAACRAHYYVAIKSDASNIFQTYAAADWIATFLAIKKINPGCVITAEHHDRWAILVDIYCGIRKAHGFSSSMVVVQHGLEFSKTYERMVDLGLSEGLPCKLKNLSTLYVYDDNQRNIFYNYIICSSVSGLPIATHYYAYRLMLSDSGLPGKSILIVGYARCEQFHLDLYMSLRSLASFNCFYKPHPTLKPSSLLLSAGWILIEDKDYFPRVDLVVSYPSTLVAEYMAAGVDVIEHEFDAEVSDVKGLGDQILSMLRQ